MLRSAVPPVKPWLSYTWRLVAGLDVGEYLERYLHSWSRSCEVPGMRTDADRCGMTEVRGIVSRSELVRSIGSTRSRPRNGDHDDQSGERSSGGGTCPTAFMRGLQPEPATPSGRCGSLRRYQTPWL